MALRGYALGQVMIPEESHGSIGDAHITKQDPDPSCFNCPLPDCKYQPYRCPIIRRDKMRFDNLVDMDKVRANLDQVRKVCSKGKLVGVVYTRSDTKDGLKQYGLNNSLFQSGPVWRGTIRHKELYATLYGNGKAAEEKPAQEAVTARFETKDAVDLKEIAEKIKQTPVVILPENTPLVTTLTVHYLDPEVYGADLAAMMALTQVMHAMGLSDADRKLVAEWFSRKYWEGGEK